MDKVFAALLITLGLFMFSCTATKKNYSPSNKYDRLTLLKDYNLLREILEHKHPSLYWYTSKDSMDMYFEKYKSAINDSMTEQQFAWKVLAPLVNKIKCGHTSVSFSKDYSKWMANKKIPSFPLFMKIWNDSMFVMVNLNRKDSIIKRGTLITSVNGLSASELSQKMFDYLPQDGNATSNNYIRMSANFPYYHRNIYGLSKTYMVSYIDSTGIANTTSIPLYTPTIDSVKKPRTARPPRSVTPKVSRRSGYRSLTIDSSGTFAVMTLHTFSKGRLRQFFRQSFKTLEKKEINNLVLDIRYNGGGKVGLSTLLTRYLTRKPFRVADSLYAVSKNLKPYTKYITGKFFN
ncbi:MAG: S41 family peptidase, partial [Chitinophagaceae bacterium]